MTREELLFSIEHALRSGNVNDFVKAVKIAPFADIAEVLSGMDIKEVSPLLLTISKEERAELFQYLPDGQQDELIAVLPRDAVVSLFELLPSDERVDIYNRLSEDEQTKLLPALAKVERDDILKLSSYPEGTAGSVTSSEYVSIPSDKSAEEAIKIIRAIAPRKETVYIVYVLDAEHKLIGTVSLRDLVLADPKAKISEIMRKEPFFVYADDLDDKATELIRHYDLLAIPVVNSENRMIGIVTVDDAMDIEREEDAAKLTKFGGTAALGGPDLDLMTSTTKQMFSVRVFWLLVLTVFGVVTSNFVAAQEEILQEVVILAAFLAPIIDMGGNTGSQSATLVIRAMALGEVKVNWKSVFYIMKREIPVALMLGACIAIAECVLAYLSKGISINVMLTVGISMFLCTILGGVIGALLPFGARLLKTDPATLSSPMITSVMDFMGVLIYFTCAYIFLSDLLI